MSTQVLVEKEPELIGASVQRIDLRVKVTGKAGYGVDMKLPNMLWGRVKRSPHPHARIVKIDYSQAETTPGVRAVITGRDFPPLEMEDTPALASGEVMYANQSVVALAAETREVAEVAVEKIDVEYEQLPAVFDPEVAMTRSTPCVIRTTAAGLDIPNLAGHSLVRSGTPEEALLKADLIVENTYATARESHFQLEPQNCLAQPDPDGGVTIWSTTSAAHKIRLEVARYLGMDPYLVRVRVPLLGGWFGSKEEGYVAAICARLALKADRPVKLQLSREEMFTATAVRHPSTIRVKDGVRKDGKIIAREVRAVYDGGAYGSSGNIVLRNGAITAISTYDIPNIRVDVYRVYTNHVPGGPKRAPMGTQMAWALESQMDEIAVRLRMDPVELRMKNVLRPTAVNAMGDSMEGTSHEKCLLEVTKALGWGKKPKAESPWKLGHGVSLAAKWGTGGPHQATLRVRPNGKVEVWADLVENGQGTLTGVAQIVADEFGIPLGDVIMMQFVRGADSESSGPTGGASASRQLTNIGKAALLAARDAKKRMAEEAARQLGVPQEEVTILSRKAYVRSNPSRSVSWASLYLEGRTLGGAAMYRMDGDFVGVGTVVKTLAPSDPETGKGVGGRVSPYYTAVAQAAEVAVNTETGQVRVRRIAAAMDVGKAINPELVRQQIVGSVVMAQSAALSEELLAEHGKITNANLADYKILTAMDAPPVQPIVVETEYHNGPYGAKGAGEASMLPTAAAIGNAIFDAIGVRIRDLPITPEKVLEAIDEKRD